MSKPNIEPIWKRWLDRILVLNVFLVIAGAGWFAVAVIGSSQGLEAPMRVFMLWVPC